MLRESVDRCKFLLQTSRGFTVLVALLIAIIVASIFGGIALGVKYGFDTSWPILVMPFVAILVALMLIGAYVVLRWCVSRLAPMAVAVLPAPAPDILEDPDPVALQV